MSNEKENNILKLDTPEKMALKDKACQELEAEGIKLTRDNIKERYIELYDEKFGKKEVEKMEAIKKVLGVGMVKDWTDEQLKDAFQKNGETMKNCEITLATASAENQVIWYEAIERKLQLVSPSKSHDPLSAYVNTDMGGAADTPADAEAPNDAAEEPSDPGEYREAGTGDVDIAGGVE